jgi:hypothetical protein
MPRLPGDVGLYLRMAMMIGGFYSFLWYSVA